MKNLLLALAFVAFTAPAIAAPACATIQSNLKEAASIGIPAENIAIIDDVEFISAYLGELGLPIPDGSAPQHMMLIATGTGGVYVGLVEQDGCIKYAKVIPIMQHSMALKAATTGV